jgi:hypothetical protein
MNTRHRILTMQAPALGLIFALFLTGCQGNTKNSKPESGTIDAGLTGTYILDATPLGMPLQIYLHIKEDDTFQWTNTQTGGDDKGNGVIGKSGDTYLLFYSDSTTETPKTATFTVKDDKLLFSTRVPYGASGFSPNTEDEDNIIYPEARKLVSEK